MTQNALCTCVKLSKKKFNNKGRRKIHPPVARIFRHMSNKMTGTHVGNAQVLELKLGASAQALGHHSSGTTSCRKGLS